MTLLQAGDGEITCQALFLHSTRKSADKHKQQEFEELLTCIHASWNVLHMLQSNQPTAVPMSEEERGELLRHLKIKWATLNAGAAAGHMNTGAGTACVFQQHACWRTYLTAGAMCSDAASGSYAVSMPCKQTCNVLQAGPLLLLACLLAGTGEQDGGSLI